MHNIVIHGAPRSGTTWLSNILNSNEAVAYRQQPLFSYAFKGFLSERSTTSEIQDFFDKILSSEDEYLHQINEIAHGKVPSFEKCSLTHLVYKETRYHYILDNLLKNSNTQFIGIIRNPLSVLHSFFNAPSEFKNEWSKEEEWMNAPKKNEGKRENYFGYQKWKETANLFHDLQGSYGEDRVKIVAYDELLTNTIQQTHDIFDWIGLSVTEQTSHFIQASKSENNSNAYSVYKTKMFDDGWKGKLPQSIVEFIAKDLQNTKLAKYL
ncbi:MAG: sulfotransferase [Bacteroidetes bacterium]|nr:sulfotransferase [Bacteroidota bacterium]